MKLDKVQISQFRNIEALSFVAHKNLNVFLGENGSGKSSILEAIHYLGFARSFRTQKHKSVIKHGEDGFTVFCTAIAEDKLNQKFGLIRRVDDSCTVNINGQKSKKATDLASFLPVQIFTPQSSDLLLGAPKLRRRYLDWLLFHVEQGFNLESQLYQKALKQINALYKTNPTNSDLKYWVDLIASKGEVISQYRELMLKNSLIAGINRSLKDFLPEFCFEISYHRGWEKGLTLREAIQKNQHKDTKNGFLSTGPHKADLKVKVHGNNAQEVLSRGQLRMLVASMQLAQTEYLHNYTSKASIFLLDDIGAELDEEKRKVFVSRLCSSNTQLFVTAIDSHQLAFLQNNNDKKMFHVEHGQVKEEI